MKHNLMFVHRPNSLSRDARTPRFLNMFREFDDLFRGWSAVPEESDNSWFTPAVDLHETDKQYAFSFDIPGVKEKDIKLNVTGHTLTVSGERKNEKKETGNEDSEFKFRTEKTYGYFERSFDLPENTQVDKIEASFKDGVLEVVVPKAEAPKAKTISIKSQ